MSAMLLFLCWKLRTRVFTEVLSESYVPSSILPGYSYFLCSVFTRLFTLLSAFRKIRYTSNDSKLLIKFMDINLLRGITNE